MLTISKPLSAGQARRYHAEEFQNARDNYYTERDVIRGVWQGQLAERWGLAGNVREDQFERLAEGQHPITGEQLAEAVLGDAVDADLAVAAAKRALPAWSATTLEQRRGYLQRLADACIEHDIAFVPFFPLGSAFTPDSPVLGHPAVKQEARKLGRTPAQIALAWTLSIAPNVLLIPGTSSVQHLEENTAVADIELDDETRTQLDDAAA